MRQSIERMLFDDTCLRSIIKESGLLMIIAKGLPYAAFCLIIHSFVFFFSLYIDCGIISMTRALTGGPSFLSLRS